MKYNCSHTFSIEAETRAEFDEKLARYSQLLRRASERLDIGYSHGLVFGQPATTHDTNQRAIADNREPEALFDD